MSKKSKKIITIVSLSVIFLALAITFFFTDLNISKAIASNNVENPNFFLKLVAAIGEFPIYIFPILFGLVFGFTSKEKWQKLLSHFIGFLAVYVANYRLVGGIFDVFFHSEFGNLQYILLPILSLLFYLLLYMLFTYVNPINLEKIRRITLIGTISVAISFVIVQILKYSFGRVRFRTLDENYSEYTNFLTINDFFSGKNGDDYRSFPSGHCASAASIIILTPLVMALTDKKWAHYLTLGLTSGYTLLVAVSRVCIGDHYASDALFGITITLVCFGLTLLVFNKKGWFNARSN